MVDRDMAEEFQDNMTKGGDMELVLGESVSSIEDREVVLESGKRIGADIVLLSIGVSPEVRLAKDSGLSLGATGGVIVNGRLESDDPDIYAVGDAAETVHRQTGRRVRIPLAGPANRQGRIAGTNAAGGHTTYRGALGTSIVRVHDATMGITGLSAKQASEAGLSFFRSTTRDLSHAGYYPGAKTITTRLIVEDGTGRLLGAQVLGQEGVDKRVDVFATAIAAGMSVEDLDTVDLAYSPPFGSAIDAANTAARVADHILKGEFKSIQAGELLDFKGTIVDVREPSELAQGKVRGSINIPLGQIRERMREIHPEKKVAVYCQKGLRGYIASKILAQNGYRVSNLSGGFLQAQRLGKELID